MIETIDVKMWGTTIGVLNYTKREITINESVASFTYSDVMVKNLFSVSPLLLPSQSEPFYFDNISYRTFKGLPGFIADSLPDKFGSQLIDLYMAEKNIPAPFVSALDRLAYVGNRGMGALEYKPQYDVNSSTEQQELDLEVLNEFASLVNHKKESLHEKLANADTYANALNFIRVSSSAGGARAKALVAIDKNGKIFDGTVNHGVDHKYYLLKFDSSENEDRDHVDPKGMTRIEYIYSLLANGCDINIPATTFIEDKEKGDFHFLIERFDRQVNKGKVEKLHYVSWSGMSHAHRDETGTYSYEQLALVCKQLNLSDHDLSEVFKRCVFNVVGRNQDDHTKNFGFLSNKSFEWSFSPAFDLTYAYDPQGRWTREHQIKLNRKQDNFDRDDFFPLAEKCNLTRQQANNIIDKTVDVFSQFPLLCKRYGVPDELEKTISSQLRCDNFRTNSFCQRKNQLTN